MGGIVTIHDPLNLALYADITANNELKVHLNTVSSPTLVLGRVQLTDGSHHGILEASGAHHIHLASVVSNLLLGRIKQQRDEETRKTKHYSWTGAVTAQIVWTPAGGKKFVICDAILIVEDSCDVRVYDQTDTTANYVFRGVYSDFGGMVSNFAKEFESSSVNNNLRITTNGGKGRITIHGYEI